MNSRPAASRSLMADSPGCTDRQVRGSPMPIPLRAGACLLLCASVTGCVALAPAVFLPQVAAAVGVAGMSAACANDPLCAGQASQCLGARGKDIEVVVQPGVRIPADEGKAATFAPAYWQPQFDAGVAARGSGVAEVADGSFVVTDKSASFVPRGNADGIRLPLAAIVGVDVQRNDSAAPRQVTVESCFGRLDRFTFGQPQQPDRLDSAATAAAAAELTARIEAARPTKK
jgi:hypothetical protein